MNQKKAANLSASAFNLPYNPRLVERARDMRKRPTAAEKKLWYDFLRTFKHRVLRQRPVDNFIVDFYCAKLKLVIMIHPDQVIRTRRKTFALIVRGDVNLLVCAPLRWSPELSSLDGGSVCRSQRLKSHLLS